MIRFLALSFLLAAASHATAAENLLVNGDFEHQEALRGWHDFWSRSGGGRAVVDEKDPHGGSRCVLIEHDGEKDWSLTQQPRIDVQRGQIYELTGFGQVRGPGAAEISVILYGPDGKAVSWSYGAARVPGGDGWHALRSRLVIPPGAAQIQARAMGNGKLAARFDDLALRRAGDVADLRTRDLPKSLAAENARLRVALDTKDATLTVLDRRSQRTWKQRALEGDGLFVLDAAPASGGFDLRLLDSSGTLDVKAAVRLVEDLPEITVELSSQGPMPQSIGWPHPFAAERGDVLILPVNEGISYPADDESLPEMYYCLYGGHGLCMGFWGMTDAHTNNALMAIVETPDDAGVRVPRVAGRLCLAPRWLAQKGRFGPTRRIRYCLFDQGGYVAMAKRYREHARKTGLLVTLAEKREKDPDVDLLVGAVNIWCWDGDPVAWCRRLQEAGIERILWSHRSKPEEIEQMNAMGVLTSRYDIYQDAMNPAEFPRLRGVHPDWTSAAWPDDLCIDASGQWVRGWRVKARDGSMISCGVLCDRLAPDYARRRIREELKTHPYRCRFIDTTTASPWRECYHPKHPMTRSESRRFKMDLLAVVSRECNLVTGSETGHEAAVPVVHYFEGMLSLGPYRVPNAGRAMMELVEDPPERVVKFQTGHFYRIPLWELVYHDCVVAQWYWGDYNNKIPKLWDRRDLFNALYGTPPMFMFHRKRWEENRERFVQSYRTAAPVARATGYREMLSHAWLTPDRAVQQTEFAGGVRVTVNFGREPFTLPDGTVLEPLGLRTEGVPQ